MKPIVCSVRWSGESLRRRASQNPRPLSTPRSALVVAIADSASACARISSYPGEPGQIAASFSP